MIYELRLAIRCNKVVQTNSNETCSCHFSICFVDFSFCKCTGDPFVQKHGRKDKSISESRGTYGECLGAKEQRESRHNYNLSLWLHYYFSTMGN